MRKESTDRIPKKILFHSFFYDEKVFAVAVPDIRQNDCLYTAQETKQRDIAADRLLRTWPTFIKSLIFVY